MGGNNLLLRICLALVLSFVSGPVMAQDQSDGQNPQCFFLCAPELKVEPTMTVEQLANRALIEVTDAETGEVSTVRHKPVRATGRRPRGGVDP